MFITESTKESFEMSIAIQSDIIKNLWVPLWYKTYIYLFIHIYKADCYIPLEFMRKKFQQLYWEIITANLDYSVGQRYRKTSDLFSSKRSSHLIQCTKKHPKPYLWRQILQNGSKNSILKCFVNHAYFKKKFNSL